MDHAAIYAGLLRQPQAKPEDIHWLAPHQLTSGFLRDFGLRRVVYVPQPSEADGAAALQTELAKASNRGFQSLKDVESVLLLVGPDAEVRQRLEAPCFCSRRAVCTHPALHRVLLCHIPAFLS